MTVKFVEFILISSDFAYLPILLYRPYTVAGWVWGEHGFLNKLGAVDIAGSGPVSNISN